MGGAFYSYGHATGMGKTILGRMALGSEWNQCQKMVVYID